MKKIFTLFAALTLIASAALADSAGGFFWSGSGATYDADQKALILENAKLSYLKIGTEENDKANFGSTFTIIVKGDNNMIYPSSDKDPITIGGVSYDEYDDITLKINGESANAKLCLVGQLHSAIYFFRSGYLRLTNLELICEGKEEKAQYAISAVPGYSYDIWAYAAVTLTLDGKISQFRDIFSFRPQGTSFAVTYPEGATMNNESGNISFSLNGSTYNGKTTIQTGSGIKIGGVELDYTNWDNFTEHVSAGTVSYSGGVLSLKNAQIDADMSISSIITLQYDGKSVINGAMNFTKGITFLTRYVGDTLTVNGDIETLGGTFNIDADLYVYAPNKAFALTLAESFISINISNSGSLYAESKYIGVGAADITAPANFTIDEYTSGGKQYLHARHVREFGISIGYLDEEIKITNENYQQVVSDGSVRYNPMGDNLILENAHLNSVSVDQDPGNTTTITLLGDNTIECNGYNGVALSTTRSLTFTGEGKLDISTLNILPAVYAEIHSFVGIVILDTEVNIDASSYAFLGTAAENFSVFVRNSDMKIKSGVSGAIHNLSHFEVRDAEFVSPVGVEFSLDLQQFCINDLPIAPNTEMVIRRTSEEGIENTVLTDQARKVLIDGNVYIIRNNKLFDLTGVQVR